MPEYAEPYVDMLQRFLHDYEIRSVVDLGCGDWQFSRLIDWSGVDYLGLDVVEFVVDTNREQFATDSIRFEVATVGEPLRPPTSSSARTSFNICRSRLSRITSPSFGIRTSTP